MYTDTCNVSVYHNCVRRVHFWAQHPPPSQHSTPQLKHTNQLFPDYDEQEIRDINAHHDASFHTLRQKMGMNNPAFGNQPSLTSFKLYFGYAVLGS